MRILLIRTSALGDIAHGLPVLRGLRRRYPDATLAWVVERSFAPMLENDPDLDAVFTVHFRHWRRFPHRPGSWRDFAGSMRAIREFRADVALDLMGNHKAGVLARISGSPRRIGLAREHRREPSSAFWLNEGVQPTGRHAVERALSVAAPLDVDATDVDFGRDQTAAAGSSRRVGPERDYAVIHPGAAWQNKRLPAERWGEVARELAEHTGLGIVVSGGPGEEDLVESVLAAARGHAIRADDRSLADLVSLLSDAKLVLAGDTGPLHVAHALGTPVLAVMGPTDPATHGPYGDPGSAVWKQLPCSFCHRRYDDTQRCLLELETSAVLIRALDLLSDAEPDLSDG